MPEGEASVEFAIDTATQAQAEGLLVTPGEKPVTALSKQQKFEMFEAIKRLRILIRHFHEPDMSEITMLMTQLGSQIRNRQSNAVRLQTLQRLDMAVARHKARSKQYTADLQSLIQKIPTVDNLPTDTDSNIVRAFIAILKSHGKVKVDAQ